MSTKCALSALWALDVHYEHLWFTSIILVQGATIRYKLDREKCRFTFAPVLAVHGPLAGFKPMIISKVKGTRWANQLRVETKKIVTDSGEYNLERRHFPSYVLYSNSKAWMTADLFIWEMERISTFLKKNHPGKNLCILTDNCSSHKRIEFENLEIVFSLHQQQGYFNPWTFRGQGHLANNLANFELAN